MNEEAKNKIKELEEELENKEIMINALLNEIKKLKNKRKIEEEYEIKRVKGDNNVNNVKYKNLNDDKVGIDLWNIEPLEKVKPTLEINSNINTVSQDKAVHVNNSPQINTSPQVNYNVNTTSSQVDSNVNNTSPQIITSSPQIKKKSLSVRDKKKLENSLKDQLDSLINYKRINKGLGNHCFFEEFVDFCVDTVPFTFGPSQPEIKQIVKSYMIQNNSRISGFICKNINSYSLLQIYSPLNCLSTILSPLESCIVFHDILLIIDDYTRLHFVFHALFKNKIDNGILGSTILNLISYQLKVDLDLYKSKKSIITNLTSLKCNFELPKSTKSLEDYLLDLTKPVPVFNKKMINENIYEYVFSIRILTHYLDWDYTFNNYFNEFLYPKLEKDDSYLLFLGICNFNFYRIFGEIESTKMVNDLLKSKMEKVSNTSILSYLLIKQIDPLIASKWLEENTNELIVQGWSIEYLTKYLLF